MGPGRMECTIKRIGVHLHVSLQYVSVYVSALGNGEKEVESLDLVWSSLISLWATERGTIIYSVFLIYFLLNTFSLTS